MIGRYRSIAGALVCALRHRAEPSAIGPTRWGDAAGPAGSEVDGGWASQCAPMAPGTPWRPA